MRRLKPPPQRYLWPSLLIPATLAIMTEVALVLVWHMPWWRAHVHNLVLTVWITSAVMAGVSRRLTPTAEAYRLGMDAGRRLALEEVDRERAEATRRLEATGTGDIPRIQPADAHQRGGHLRVIPGHRR